MHRPALTLALVLLAAPALGEAPPPHLAPGTRAPEVTVERLLGGELRLSALRGKVVLLDFWASWCPPCRAELPWMLKLARRLEGRGLAFVAMNQDEGPSQRALALELAEAVPGLARHVALGGPAVGGPFGVDGLPTLYLLDREGRVLASAEGRLTEAEVTAAVERALR